MKNEVFNEIEKDIFWRKSELEALREIASNLYDVNLSIFLKSIPPSLYAHWEGFVVSSLRIVFKYLNTLKLSSKDYCDTYLTTAYEQKLKSLDDSKDFDRRKNNLIDLCKKFTEQVELDITRIDTKSNLNFKALENICKKTNLHISRFNDYKIDLNKLVNIRNAISHGENAHSFKSYDDIQEYIELLNNLISTFYNELQILLNEKKYLKVVK